MNSMLNKKEKKDVNSARNTRTAIDKQQTRLTFGNKFHEFGIQMFIMTNRQSYWRMSTQKLDVFSSTM